MTSLAKMLATVCVVFALSPFTVLYAQDSNEGFMFYGDDGRQGERPATDVLNQELLIVAVEPKWTNSGVAFADAKTLLLENAGKMSDFWNESSYGKVSFSPRVLGERIFKLDKSFQYFYHRSMPRRLLTRTLPTVTTFPEDSSLVVTNDGQPITVSFPQGDYGANALRDLIQGALTAADSDQAPPSFTVQLSGAQLSLNTTVDAGLRSTIELSGDALPYLGFGSSDLYNRGDATPAVLIFGRPVQKQAITFTTGLELTVQTQGSVVTTVMFVAGETLDLAEVVARIRAAYPGEGVQQPFTIESYNDPADDEKAYLAFATNVDSANNDDGLTIVVAGSAGDILGLSTGGANDSGIVQRFEPEAGDLYDAIAQGFDKYAETLPAGTSMEDVFGNARLFVASIMDSVNFYRASASFFSFNIRGEVFEVGAFADSWNGSWQVFAHETGHTLGLPDLYRRGIALGTEPGIWDIMHCSTCDSQPTSYMRNFEHVPPADRPVPWMANNTVLSISPPSVGATRRDKFILTPLESPWSSDNANPFAAAHPDIPVVHAVRFVPTDESDVFIAENRQKGVYQADHLGDRVDYSTGLPSEGIIFYEGRRIPSSAPAHFLAVNLLTPMNDPLDTVGESFRHTLTLANGIELKIIEVLTNPDASGGAPSFSYLVESVWGEGSFFDISIRDWTPPPWETADVWIDNRVENDWDVYSHASDEEAGSRVPILNGDNVAVEQDNRLYARIRNLGDVAIVGEIEVLFKIVVPVRVGQSDQSEIETDIGKFTINGLGARGDADAEKSNYIIWKPAEQNEGHVCIKVYVTPVTGERNETLNNTAQENVTQWYSASASPFEPVKIKIITENPFKDRMAQIRLGAPKVANGWSLWVEDVKFNLKPGENRVQTVTITPDLGRLRPMIDKKGFADPYSANLEARVLLGDHWVPFGGITAVVNPINKASELRLDPAPEKVVEGGPPPAKGTVKSKGPMRPPLADRSINLRFRSLDGTKELWVRTRTNANGRFVGKAPTAFEKHSYRVKAFHSGGRGIGPLRSAEETVFLAVDTKRPKRKFPIPEKLKLPIDPVIRNPDIFIKIPKLK